jgi:hypothetical protein
MPSGAILEKFEVYVTATGKHPHRMNQHLAPVRWITRYEGSLAIRPPRRQPTAGQLVVE